jgi:thioredoxin reductase (NADPH)
MAGGPIDVIVIGGGIAGLWTARSCLEHGLRPLILEPELPGGLVANVGELTGFLSETSGIELATAILNPLLDAGVELVPSAAEALRSRGNKVTVRAGGKPRQARAAVIACGAPLARLDVPGWDDYLGRGISQCAYCDAGLHKDQVTVVVGGGDAALQEALHLAQFASRVILVNRGSRLRAKAQFRDRALDEPRIEFRWDTRVVRFEGDASLERIVLATDDGEEQVEQISGAFVFIGVEHRLSDLSAELSLAGDGSLEVDHRLATSMEQVYAAGLARSGFGGHLTQALADGTQAANSIAATLG